MIKRKSNFIFTFCCLIVICFGFISCDTVFEPTDIKEGEEKNPILLTEDKWTNGKILDPASGGSDEQWYIFTATDSTQYIYAKLSTIEGLDIYLFDNNLNQIGSCLSFRGSSGTVRNASYSLELGKTYYLKVLGYYDNYVGSYWIGFTNFPAQPETAITNLSENIWTNGNIIHPNSGGTGEQWYIFTATDSTQYIYVKLSTIEGLDVYLFDNNFNQIGSCLSFRGSSGTVRNASYVLESGKAYYLKVLGYYDNYVGSYWITFNDSGIAPN